MTSLSSMSSADLLNVDDVDELDSDDDMDSDLETLGMVPAMWASSGVSGARDIVVASTA